jgi:hypothetical protein
MKDFTHIKALGALNAERLLTEWGVEYKLINEAEIDIINSARGDKSFGACRYNMVKDIGSDFAAPTVDDSVFKSLGPTFDRSDFNLQASASRMGFDIIGLAKMLFNYPSNTAAAERLANDLERLDAVSPIARITEEAIAQRKALAEHKKAKKIDFARSLLEKCSSYKGTLGEIYLNYRGIKLTDLEGTIRFHSAVQHDDGGIKALYPTLVFPIQSIPNGTVEGIHRIYLQRDGRGKAPVTNPKMALGPVRGNAVWFGEPNEILYVAEGPENALSVYCSGAKFVACAINAGNMPNIAIPSIVRVLVICGDRDKAGIAAVKETVLRRELEGFTVQVLYPKKMVLPNGKYADFNDVLRAGK